MKKRFSAVLTAAIALILALIMVSGCSFISGREPSAGITPNDSQIAAQTVNFETTPKAHDIEDAFIDAVSKVKRSSVQILTGSGAGSGVIVDISFNETESTASWKNDENMIYIITCHHMVSVSGTFGASGTGEIEVRIPDEDYSYENKDYVFYGYVGNSKPSVYNDKGYAITLVGGDFESDIALLKLDLDIAAASGNKLSKDKIVKAQIPDDSYSAQLGETIFAVGNPTGTLPGTVSRGIISHEHTRSVEVDDIGTMELMQIDVSTNPGNSGGGLYNLYGELIGITNAGNTNYTNINFAIPCYLENGNGFVEIAKQLGGTATDDNYGYVSGRLVRFGFTIVENDESDEPFVYIKSVTNGSIAYNKLQANDVILSMTVARNNEQILSRSVSTLEEVGTVMGSLTAGDVLTITVSRSYWGRPTQSKTVQMTVESFRFCDTGEYAVQ